MNETAREATAPPPPPPPEPPMANNQLVSLEARDAHSDQHRVFTKCTHVGQCNCFASLKRHGTLILPNENYDEQEEGACLEALANGVMVRWKPTPCQHRKRTYSPPLNGKGRYGDLIEAVMRDSRGDSFVFAECGHQYRCSCYANFDAIKWPLIIASDAGVRKETRPGAFSGIGVYVGPGSPFNVSEVAPPCHAGPTTLSAELSAGLRALQIVVRLKKEGRIPGVEKIILKTDNKDMKEIMAHCMLSWRRNGFSNAALRYHDLLRDMEEAVVELYNTHHIAALFYWTPREYNHEADQLATLALRKEDCGIEFAQAKGQVGKTHFQQGKRKYDDEDAPETQVLKRLCAPRGHAESRNRPLAVPFAPSQAPALSNDARKSIQPAGADERLGSAQRAPVTSSVDHYSAPTTRSQFARGSALIERPSDHVSSRDSHVARLLRWKATRSGQAGAQPRRHGVPKTSDLSAQQHYNQAQPPLMSTTFAPAVPSTLVPYPGTVAASGSGQFAAPASSSKTSASSFAPAIPASLAQWPGLASALQDRKWSRSEVAAMNIERQRLAGYEPGQNSRSRLPTSGMGKAGLTASRVDMPSERRHPMSISLPQPLGTESQRKCPTAPQSSHSTFDSVATYPSTPANFWGSMAGATHNLKRTHDETSKIAAPTTISDQPEHGAKPVPTMPSAYFATPQKRLRKSLPAVEPAPPAQRAARRDSKMMDSGFDQPSPFASVGKNQVAPQSVPVPDAPVGGGRFNHFFHSGPMRNIVFLRFWSPLGRAEHPIEPVQTNNVLLYGGRVRKLAKKARLAAERSGEKPDERVKRPGLLALYGATGLIHQLRALRMAAVGIAEAHKAEGWEQLVLKSSQLSV